MEGEDIHVMESQQSNNIFHDFVIDSLFIVEVVVAEKSSKIKVEYSSRFIQPSDWHQFQSQATIGNKPE